MRSIAASVFAILLLVVPSQAQTSTITPKAAAADGNTNNNVPYPWYPTRYQQLFDPDSFSHGTSVLRIGEIAFRMASGYRDGTWGGQSTRVSVWCALAPTGVSSSQFSWTFDANVDLPTKRLVIANRTVTMPSLASNAFGFSLKFDAPTTFLYDPGQRRALVIETIKWSGPYVTYPLDAVDDPQLGKGTARLWAFESEPGLGESYYLPGYYGCAGTGPRPAEALTNNTALFRVGGTGADVRVRTYVTGRVAVGVFGTNQLDLLLPGTSCRMVNDILWLVVGLATPPNGDFIIPLAVPADPRLAFAKLRFQGVVVDPTANRLGLTTTNGLLLVVGTGLPTRTPLDQIREAHHALGNAGLVHRMQ
jgi:hypothetical protein